MANKINPFHILHKLPFQKKRYEKLGMNIYNEIDRSFGDKKFGLSTIVAAGMLWGVLDIFFFALLLLSNLISYGTMLHIIIVSALSSIICYIFVFKNDKYLNYFDEFEKCSKVEKRKYAWLTLASIVAISFLFYIGLIT